MMGDALLRASNSGLPLGPLLFRVAFAGVPDGTLAKDTVPEAGAWEAGISTHNNFARVYGATPAQAVYFSAFVENGDLYGPMFRVGAENYSRFYVRLGIAPLTLAPTDSFQYVFGAFGTNTYLQYYLRVQGDGNLYLYRDSVLKATIDPGVALSAISRIEIMYDEPELAVRVNGATRHADPSLPPLGADHDYHGISARGDNFTPTITEIAVHGLL